MSTCRVHGLIKRENRLERLPLERAFHKRGLAHGERTSNECPAAAPAILPYYDYPVSKPQLAHRPEPAPEQCEQCKSMQKELPHFRMVSNRSTLSVPQSGTELGDPRTS